MSPAPVTTDVGGRAVDEVAPDEVAVDDDEQAATTKPAHATAAVATTGLRTVPSMSAVL
jgi:hypothetical protein